MDNYIIVVVTVCMMTVASVKYETRVQKTPDHPARSRNISDEKRVIKYLLETYDIAGRGGRPVLNMSIPTVVMFGLGLIQLDLDEKKKIFTTSMWSRLFWNDAYLVWNPADYGGVAAVRMESTQVWIPDIMLINTADPEGRQGHALVTITYDGNVSWVPHNIFQSSCSINVTNFPFDSQQCHMWFGSWSYSAREIDVNMAYPGGIDLTTFQSDYKDSAGWEIIRPEAERKLLPLNDSNPFAVLSFTLHLQRKIVFSSYILTLPCIFLAFLTLVVFWLPPERPDRTGLAMALFSSFLLLLLLLVEASPPTASSIPRLGIYYCFNMVIIMTSIFLSSMIVNIHRGGEYKRKVPKWLRVITLDILGRIFCMAFYRNDPSSRSTTYTFKRSDIKDEEDIQRILTIRTEADSFRYQCEPRVPMETADSNSNSSINTKIRLLERHLARLDNQVGDVKKTLDTILEASSEKETQLHEMRMIAREWKLVALTLDRLFFSIYFITVVTSLLVLFPRPPGWLGK